MVFKEPGFPQNDSDNLSKEGQMEEFAQKIKEIEMQVGLIDVWKGDELNKESKQEALRLIGELKTATEPEKRKELISDLRTAVGMIDVWKGDEQNKVSKSKAQELIEKLG